MKPNPKYIWSRPVKIKEHKYGVIYAAIVIITIALFLLNRPVEVPNHTQVPKDTIIQPAALIEPNNEPQYETIQATVTGYNSLSVQTDSTPCLGSAGQICGRKDVVACPRKIALGTKVIIGGKTYACLDRLSRQYPDRFDIFFDKDTQAALKFGKQVLPIQIID